MRILLLGEYSRLHNSLKTGLMALGNDVTLAGTGDHFKKYPVDVSFEPRLTRYNFLFKFLKRAVYRMTKINLEETETGIRFYFRIKELKDFDVVQLINSNALETHPSWSRYLLKKLFKQNKKVFLLVCGDETPVVDYLLKRELKYDTLTPYFENPSLKNKFEYSLKYTNKPHRQLFEFVKNHSTNIFVSDIDYKIPMEKMGFDVVFIPNPVVLQEITKIQLLPINKKITIFLGINNFSRIKKGVPYFEEALTIIKEKYPDKIEVIIGESLPYADYIKLYESAHIFLDMVYAYDQGYNALEAMAKGKVVFTGAESEFLEHYNLKEDEVCINALPDVDYLVNKLSRLIENPTEISRISKNAQEFVTREHHFKTIAEKYLAEYNAS